MVPLFGPHPNLPLLAQRETVLVLMSSTVAVSAVVKASSD
jgi:hypothetical protein